MMADQPVTIDMSTLKPIDGPVTIDMSTAQPLDGAPSQKPEAAPQESYWDSVNQHAGDVLKGMGKGLAATAQTIHNLNAPSDPHDSMYANPGKYLGSNVDTKPANDAQRVGKFAETGAEMAATGGETGISEGLVSGVKEATADIMKLTPKQVLTGVMDMSPQKAAQMLKDFSTELANNPSKTIGKLAARGTALGLTSHEIHGRLSALLHLVGE